VKYHELRRMLFETLSTVGFKPWLPKGAYYIIAGIDSLKDRLTAKDDVSFSRKLIERTGVATIPGTSFYASPGKGGNQVRFCFCKKVQTLEKVREGLQAI